MEECVIIGQGQECSMDRFSPTKRALNVPGMAEPRGQGDIALPYFYQIRSKTCPIERPCNSVCPQIFQWPSAT